MGKLLLILGSAVVGIVGFILIMLFVVGKDDYSFTGDQLFTAVQKYRERNGLDLTLNARLCDNLVERYLAINSPDNGHKGFDEWVVDEKIQEEAHVGLIGELYVKGQSTPESSIAWWESSPGHRSTLQMPELKEGCAYANDGTGVVILAAPVATPSATK